MPSEGPRGGSYTIEIGDEIFDNICYGCPVGKQADKKLKMLIERFVKEQAEICKECIAKKKPCNCACKVMYPDYELNAGDLRIRWWKSIEATNITRLGIDVSPSAQDIKEQLVQEAEKRLTCCGKVRYGKFCPECGKQIRSY